MTPPRSYLDAIREVLLEALECEDEIWSWFCPACRPPKGDPGAGGSVGAGG